MDDDWVVLCQALYHSIGEEEWTDMHDNVTEVCRKIGERLALQSNPIASVFDWVAV